jgi:hypothetical protein
MQVNKELLNMLQKPADPMFGYAALVSLIFHPELEHSAAFRRGRSRKRNDEYYSKENPKSFLVMSRTMGLPIFDIPKETLGFDKSKATCLTATRLLLEGKPISEVELTLGIEPAGSFNGS